MKKCELLLLLIFIFTLFFATDVYSGDKGILSGSNKQNVLIIKEIPDNDTFPVDVSPENQVCSVMSGTKAELIEKKYYEKAALTYVKVTILDGFCADKSGWTEASNFKIKSN